MSPLTVVTHLLAAAALSCSPAAAARASGQLETSRDPQGLQRSQFPEGDFKFSFPKMGKESSDAAHLSYAIDKGSYPFLSTLQEPGLAMTMVAMKPCSVLLPHVHSRANKIMTVLSGTMNAGVSQENDYDQSVELEVVPGENFVVSNGLLHYAHNAQCDPLVVLFAFGSADPGTVDVVTSLAAIAKTNSAVAEAGGTTGAKGEAHYVLDSKCLKKCGLPAGGGSLDGMSKEMKALVGLK